MNILRQSEGTDASGTSDTSVACPAFGDPTDSKSFAYVLQSIFNYIKFAGIILAIIMTLKDIIAAVADPKDDSFKKLGTNTIKRIGYAIVIFFLPTLINYFFNLIGLYGTCGIE
jgi:hypothetical protein